MEVTSDYFANMEEEVVRFVAGCSVVGSAYLLWHCACLTRRSLLAKQVMHLSFVNLLAALWMASFPYSADCDLKDKVFKYFVGVSVCTDLMIATGTLAAARRWTWINTLQKKCGVRSLLLSWLLAAVLMVPFFLGRSEFDAVLGFCVESHDQLMTLFVLGILFVPAVFFSVLGHSMQRAPPLPALSCSGLPSLHSGTYCSLPGMLHPVPGFFGLHVVRV